MVRVPVLLCAPGEAIHEPRGGAGGGGFLVFYVEPEHQAAVRQAMQELLYIPFRFENGGTRVIYYAPEEEPAL